MSFPTKETFFEPLEKRSRVNLEGLDDSNKENVPPKMDQQERGGGGEKVLVAESLEPELMPCTAETQSHELQPFPVRLSKEYKEVSCGIYTVTRDVP